MHNKVLKVHPRDNIIVALQDLQKGERVVLEEEKFNLVSDVPSKHKFAAVQFAPGDQVIMYGVIVGKATKEISSGEVITTRNIVHATADYQIQSVDYEWIPPDHSEFANRTFMGYHRSDGQVGTMNYWLVIPLVFCENRNINVIREALNEQLGYATAKSFRVDTQSLIDQYQSGQDASSILATDIILDQEELRQRRIFQNVDGIKYLTHEGGCGGTRQDTQMLCKLLAGYINHSNVAGATLLSLGCQNAQVSLMKQTMTEHYPNCSKPIYYLEQQDSESERELIANAVKQTFAGLMEANKIERAPASLSKLKLGLECGGSDGFSGLTANPALGYTSDLLVALGGTTMLAEFPELNGIEQELINRCSNQEIARKFSSLMKSYSDEARRSQSSFAFNPSPGNIRDGLITDAIKSAGAAKKGGTSPVTDVLDYAEPSIHPGLNLVCTPGNDVESTTGLAGSGANIIVFTTGLGTPTGNAVAPTIKVSTNSQLAQRMEDIIDLDTGSIISGASTIESKGRELLELIITVASGDVVPKAVHLGQDDFIPWKRGISL